jgi:hypothetical protein
MAHNKWNCSITQNDLSHNIPHSIPKISQNIPKLSHIFGGLQPLACDKMHYHAFKSILAKNDFCSRGILEGDPVNWV